MFGEMTNSSALSEEKTPLVYHFSGILALQRINLMFSLTVIYATLDLFKRKMLQTIIEFEGLLWIKLYDDVIATRLILVGLWNFKDGGS